MRPRRAVQVASDLPPSNRVSERKASLLIVDDNRDAAVLMGEVLAALSYDVRVAHDGPSALAIVERFTPDCALLDIGLPGMDGYELARALGARFPALRAIAITAYDHDDARARGVDAGFIAHLVKPVSLPDLIETLNDLLHE
jgi:CheY-like chemotaxis protein